MIDLNSAVGQLRLETGDVSDIPVLSDAEYTYILSQHNDVVKDSVIDALYAVLARLSYNTDQRLDRIQFWGSQSFEQYKTFVQDKIKNLTGVGILANKISVYAGGISKTDAEKYSTDDDLIQFSNPFDSCSNTTLRW